MDIIHCDVLIVGGGGGALKAAISCKEHNKDLKVIIATKGTIGNSGVTAIACSDRMAFHATLDHTEPDGVDSWRHHAEDIYAIGGKVSDYDLAEILARNSKDAFQYLDKLGVPFVKKNGHADQFLTDGSLYARACYTGPKTAVHIEQALLKRYMELDIEVLNNCMVVELVKKEGRVIGALALDTKIKDVNKGLHGILAEAVILATGGAGKIYKNNVYPSGMWGDGYALAYDAGAELVNMEFIQMGVASTKTKINCSGSLMRAMPNIINEKGEEILKKYLLEDISCGEMNNLIFEKGFSWPISNEAKTNIIDIAVYKETRKGHKVYLDYSKNPEHFKFDELNEINREYYLGEISKELGNEKRNEAPIYRLMEINQPSINWLFENGVDLLMGETIEVACCAQHFQGGIKIDKLARSTVEGLWAVGEVAGGQHGANRPGGNALLDCQVFGKIAGKEAAEYVIKKNKYGIDGEKEIIIGRIGSFRKVLMEAKYGNTTAKQIKEKIQEIMDKECSVVRTMGLKKALQNIKEMESLKICIDHHGPAYYIESRNIMNVSKMVVSAALLRNESRGPHLRFSKYEDNIPADRNYGVWDKYIVISKKEKMILEVKETNT